MKFFLDTINGSIKKFAKGMLAIFVIKLLLFGGAFVIQSCQNEDIIDISKEQALNNFENQLYQSKSSIKNFISDNNLNGSSKKESIYSKKESIYSKKMELEASKVINPLIDSSIELIKSYGITSEEISEHFTNLSDERLALIGLILYSSEKEFEKSISSNIANDLFIQSSYAQSIYLEDSSSYLGDPDKWPRWLKCALVAFGVDFLFFGSLYALAEYNRWSRKAILKLFGKIVSRALGPIGTVIVVGTFAQCMGWWFQL